MSENIEQNAQDYSHMAERRRQEDRIVELLNAHMPEHLRHDTDDSGYWASITWHPSKWRKLLDFIEQMPIPEDMAEIHTEIVNRAMFGR